MGIGVVESLVAHDEGRVDARMLQFALSTLSPRERLAIEYARKVSETPLSFTPVFGARLPFAGLTEDHGGMTPPDPLMPTARHPELDELIAVLEKLRALGGCVWDREQTHASLVQYLVEETFELVEAIEAGNRDELIEELGDVLYQVIFHADIAAEAGEFTLEDVAAHMRQKMVARHPHVFGDITGRVLTADTPDDVVATWEAVKAVEKAHRTSVLEGIPEGMPSLALADKILGRAAKVGVVREAAVIPTTEQGLGDELLAKVVAAKAAGLDAERALRGALRELQDEVRTAETESH